LSPRIGPNLNSSAARQKDTIISGTFFASASLGQKDGKDAPEVRTLAIKTPEV